MHHTDWADIIHQILTHIHLCGLVAVARVELLGQVACIVPERVFKQRNLPATSNAHIVIHLAAYEKNPSAHFETCRFEKSKNRLIW